MSTVASAEEAEGIAKDWMKRKYGGNVERCKFTHVTLQNGAWTLTAEVLLRKGLVHATSKVLVVQVDASTTKVIGYSEHPGQSEVA